MSAHYPLKGYGNRMEHGYSAYTNHGCRCEVCKEANRDAVRLARERRAWRVAMGESVPHGLDSTYSNYRCRCDLCKQAHRVAARKFLIRQRVAKKLAP